MRRYKPTGLVVRDIAISKKLETALELARSLSRNRHRSILILCPRELMGHWYELLTRLFNVRSTSDLCDSHRLRHEFWSEDFLTIIGLQELYPRGRIFDETIRQESWHLILIDQEARCFSWMEP